MERTANTNGYQRSWNQRPLQYQTDRVHGMNARLYYQGIDFTKMRLDRTEKVRQAMEKYGYDALLSVL